MCRNVNWNTPVFFFFFGGEEKLGGVRNWEIGTDTREDPLEEESAPTPVFSPGEPRDRGACRLQSRGHRDSDTTEGQTLSLS